MKKLSPAQQRVLDLMAEGWELGLSHGPYPRTWLQKGGVGRGGLTEGVGSSTYIALYTKGLIRTGERTYPTQKYELVKCPDETPRGCGEDGQRCLGDECSMIEKNRAKGGRDA